MFFELRQLQPERDTQVCYRTSPNPPRGSPLLNTDIKVLTTIGNLGHKEPHEWKQLVLASPETQVTYEDSLRKHRAMQKNFKRNNTSRVSEIELNSVDAEKEKRETQNNFFELLPLELSLQIFSQLDMQSLCRASMTCKSWNYIIIISDSLWEPHCLAVRAVCKREIDDDLKSGYSWRDTLLRNYQKSKVKLEWLSGRYSNICSPISLPEKIMYPMDAETWGEILEAELKRYVEKSQADLITLRV